MRRKGPVRAKRARCIFIPHACEDNHTMRSADTFIVRQLEEKRKCQFLRPF